MAGCRRARYTSSKANRALARPHSVFNFLFAGQRRGEPTLWITLSETERQLLQSARSHGWSLDGTEVCNPAAPDGHSPRR